MFKITKEMEERAQKYKMDIPFLKHFAATNEFITLKKDCINTQYLIGEYRSQYKTIYFMEEKEVITEEDKTNLFFANRLANLCSFLLDEIEIKYNKLKS